MTVSNGRATIRVNGSARDLPAGATVARLVADIAPEARMLAVEKNGEIVPRSLWGETPLASGDRIEIVRFVQGG